MRDISQLLYHLAVCIIMLLRPGGLKSVAAENLILRQQLIVISRTRKRSPRLTQTDRTLFALLAHIIPTTRLRKLAITVKPATILKFHQAMVQKKYRALYSSKSPGKPGPKGPDQELIHLVVDIKHRNPRMGYDRIAMQVLQAFGVKVDKHVVRRILAKHYNPPCPGGPSWLTFLGQAKDSLWSIDLFRCESIHLRSHWVMLAIDIYTRRIVGFSVHAGDISGVTACRLFNQILGSRSPPVRISTDHDPIFRHHRWKATLRILDIDEVKTVPYTPLSHPFVERTIGTVKREFLDQTLFWNEADLSRKLGRYNTYYNEFRGHLSLNGKTPLQVAKKACVPRQPIRNYSWISHCNGLFHTPTTAQY
jgi:transposase InsO family protein